MNDNKKSKEEEEKKECLTAKQVRYSEGWPIAF